MSLWADRISTRSLNARSRVGYGGKGVLQKSSTVSSYDIGYGDGWPRDDYVLPDGRALIGRVSMDAISVEGSDDTICLFSDASDAAVQFGTISYEIMTRLSPSIKRVVV